MRRKELSPLIKFKNNFILLIKSQACLKAVSRLAGKAGDLVSDLISKEFCYVLFGKFKTSHLADKEITAALFTFCVGLTPVAPMALDDRFSAFGALDVLKYFILTFKYSEESCLSK